MNLQTAFGPGAIAAGALLAACGARVDVDGVLVSNFGRPVSAALLTNADGRMLASSGAEGHFRLAGYRPGSTVRVSHPDYTTLEFVPTAGERSLALTEPVVLYRALPGTGLYTVGDQGYVELAVKTQLEDAIEDSHETERVRTWSIPARSNFQQVACGGRLMLYGDARPSGKSSPVLFRLGYGNQVYGYQWSFTESPSTYRPLALNQIVGEELVTPVGAVLAYSVRPGRYVLTRAHELFRSQEEYVFELSPEDARLIEVVQG